MLLSVVAVAVVVISVAVLLWAVTRTGAFNYRRAVIVISVTLGVYLIALVIDRGRFPGLDTLLILIALLLLVVAGSYFQLRVLSEVSERNQVARRGERALAEVDEIWPGRRAMWVVGVIGVALGGLALWIASTMLMSR